MPSEDERIKLQIEEAEGNMQRELAQLDPGTAEESTESRPAAKSPLPGSKLDIEQPSNAAKETVSSETNGDHGQNGNTNDETTDQNANVSHPEIHLNQQENPKDHDDDGDEMVEADEDMVIY